MSEFVVWDYDNEIFIDKDNCVFVGGTLFRNEKYFVNKISNDLEMFFYIQLEDINNNKIYANCSIVQWLHGNITYYGYFNFNLEKLCYEVVVIGSDLDNIYEKTTVIYHYLNMENIKIIDTIQENKLCLIKEG